MKMKNEYYTTVFKLLFRLSKQFHPGSLKHIAYRLFDERNLVQTEILKLSEKYTGICIVVAAKWYIM